MKQTKKQKNESLSLELERAANEGHYLERLENMVALIGRDDIMGVMLALKQIHSFTGHKPDCTDAVQADISERILSHCKYRLKFTNKQLSLMWYGVHWDARETFELKFPYGGTHGTNEMKSNTTFSKGA